MPRPNPIQYAERLYAAIRAANFSPISFLAFGNAVKDGVDLRRMPRIAAEPFMRVVGEMLDLEEEARQAEALDAVVATASAEPSLTTHVHPADGETPASERAATSDSVKDLPAGVDPTA
jgi:hypothetical protein